jgi:hypothetical protein
VFKLLGGAAEAAGGLPLLAQTARAQEDLVVTNNYQNFNARQRSQPSSGTAHRQRGVGGSRPREDAGG